MSPAAQKDRFDSQFCCVNVVFSSTRIHNKDAIEAINKKILKQFVTNMAKVAQNISKILNFLMQKHLTG